jgi:septum formation protein
VPHVVVAVETDERVADGEGVGAYLERVALAKLDAVRARVARERLAQDLVLVADTSVLLDGEILGKPASGAEAHAMIARLAGRAHEVWTRFVLAEASVGTPLHAETVATRVTFRAFDDEEVAAYAASGEGRDKAGAYAVQGLGAAFVSRIEGSYSNVVGLPACEVVVALRRLGLRW